MQDHRPTSHFKRRKEEAKLFGHLRDTDAESGVEPVNSTASVLYTSEGLKGLSSSALGMSFYLKRRFKVSKEVKVGVSGKVNFEDGLPHASDPSVEFQHKLGSVHGSSIIVTAHSIALAHVRRMTRAGNSWVSFLTNFAFSNDRLTAKQLSLCARFHPEGSEWLDNTVTTWSFDAPKIESNGDFLAHGYLTATALTQVHKNVVTAVQVSQATGKGSGQTLKGGQNYPDFNPIVQLGLRASKDLYSVTATATLDSKALTQKSTFKLSATYLIEPVNVNLIASTSFNLRQRNLKWAIGAFVNIDDIISL